MLHKSLFAIFARYEPATNSDNVRVENSLIMVKYDKGKRKEYKQMGTDFFEDGFAFEEYVEKRLTEVENINQRKDRRALVKNIMLPFCQHVEKKYQQLVKQLRDQGKQTVKNYNIAVTIAKRQDIDLTEDSMTPMRMEDMKQPYIKIKEIYAAATNGREYYLYTVFMESSYKQLADWQNIGRRFSGVIETEYGTYPAVFEMRLCTRYRKMVDELYPVFLRNGIPWTTVNMSYLFKMFDVFLVSCELPEEDIVQVSVDFEELACDIKEDMVPMWNLHTLVMHDCGYPELCFDRISYRHTIFQHRLKPERKYLVCNENVTVWNTAWQEGDFTITCDKDGEMSWKLLEFCPVRQRKKYSYPSMQNRNTGKPVDCIRTYGEIAHFVKELGYEDILAFVDARLEQEDVAEWKQYYEAEIHLQDAFRQQHCGQNLLLEFEAVDKDYFLNYDILSYLVSRVQWELPEYHCSGRLVSGTRENS